MKNKLKSEILNDKKPYKPKYIWGTDQKGGLGQFSGDLAKNREEGFFQGGRGLIP